jgi:hypothetical protein
MGGIKSFDKLQRGGGRAITGGTTCVRCGVERCTRWGGQSSSWSCERRRVARSSARAHRHLGILGNFRDVQSELFTNYPTTPHYNIYAVIAAFVLRELVVAPESSLLVFIGFSSHYGDE